MAGIGVHDDRNRVQHRSESVFTVDWNGCSRWSGIRTAAATSRTPWTIATIGRDRDGQGESAHLLLEVHRAIDESALLLNPVQDSLDLHPAVGLRERLASSTAILAESTRDASSIAAPWSRVEADASVDAQNAPTDPCKTTERFRTSSHTPHRCLSFRTTSDRNLSVCWGSDPQILRRSEFRSSGGATTPPSDQSGGVRATHHACGLMSSSGSRPASRVKPRCRSFRRFYENAPVTDPHRARYCRSCRDAGSGAAA